MATPTAAEVPTTPTGLDTPLANTVETTDTPMRPAEQEASTGSSPGTAEAGAGGAEQVAGFQLPESAAAVTERVLDDSLAYPDVSAASFGSVVELPASVIGPDDRVQITATDVYPWRVHASLLVTAADGSRWIGIGWFIGPHPLITAGHVVYIKYSGVPGRDGFVRSIQVMAGRNGNTLPFGAVTSSNFRTVAGWGTTATRTSTTGPSSCRPILA